MVDWQVMEGIGGVATAVAVVVALGLGVAQMRSTTAQRRDAAAYSAIERWSDPAALRQLDRVYGLPDGAPADVVEAADADGSVSAVYMRLELLGILVHGRMLPLALAEEWAGGVVLVTWRKLRVWIEEKRRRTASQRPGEWFQWLAERLAERRGRDETVGAFVAHRDWKE